VSDLAKLHAIEIPIDVRALLEKHRA
jgi:hypothetical protein